jgi:hypothetical protein
MDSRNTMKREARLAPYRADAKRRGWTDEQFELACDQAGDEQGMNDDAFFTALCDFVEGAMPCSYWRD